MFFLIQCGICIKEEVKLLPCNLKQWQFIRVRGSGKYNSDIYISHCKANYSGELHIILPHLEKIFSQNPKKLPNYCSFCAPYKRSKNFSKISLCKHPKFYKRNWNWKLKGSRRCLIFFRFKQKKIKGPEGVSAKFFWFFCCNLLLILWIEFTDCLNTY